MVKREEPFCRNCQKGLQSSTISLNSEIVHTERACVLSSNG